MAAAEFSSSTRKSTDEAEPISSSYCEVALGDVVRRAVFDDDDVLHRRERGGDLLVERQERAVDEDHLVLGVVDDVGQLIGEQPDVEGVQDPPGARRGEVQLEVP